MTNKFKLKYSNGTTEVVRTDAVDVADQINRTFGMTLEEAEAFGVGAEMLPADSEDTHLDLTNREADESLLQDLTQERIEGTVEENKAKTDAPETTVAEAAGTAGEPGTAEAAEADATEAEAVHVNVGISEESRGDDNMN